MQLSRFRHFLSRTLLIHKCRIDIHLVAPGKQQTCGLKFFIILKVINIMVKATNITSAINIKLLLSQAMINYGWKFYPHQKWVMKSYNWLKTDRNISNASCQLSSGEYETDSTDDQCPDWLAYSFRDWPDLCCVVSKTRWRQRFRHP